MENDHGNDNPGLVFHAAREARASKSTHALQFCTVVHFAWGLLVEARLSVAPYS